MPARSMIEHRSELMLLEFNRSLERPRNLSLRQVAILKVERDNSTNLVLINRYLISKYKLNESDINAKNIV